MHKIGPAIAAGNPIILKPASKTSITGILLGKLLIDAGYPRKAINVLPGPGGIIGDRLVSDDRIKVVTFTGSAEVGKAIVKKAGLKHIAMELGSNSAVIVMSDSDILHAANRIIKGAMALAGQVCISVQRVYAELPIYEKLVELLTLAAKNIKLGDPLNEQTEMGPMISEADAKRTDGLIQEAVSLGAEITTGGKHNGTLFQPTVLINVPQHAKIIQTEAFAPIVVINKISDLNEGIALVNDSKFGLQAGIFTRDINSAHTAFKKIDVGGVIINDVPTFRADIMPYGGIKDSGLGREGPRYAIEHMTYIKVCAIHNSDYE
jgi:acyl-CoA reductase-like NAD-dependent aldehyde dehydrogenase